MTARKKTGPKIVVMMNHFVRTRSTYSRLITAQSLPMAGHPRLDARRADPFEEDLVQRRLHELEALDARARVHETLEQRLGIGAPLKRDLEEAVRVVHALDHPVVAQHLAHELRPAVGERERDIVAPVFGLHAGDRAVEHLLAARDDADRVAE